MRTLLILGAALAFGRAASADEQSGEDRLRDALRQMVTQMRAAQDQAAQSQADLQKAQAAQQATQAQLDAANAKLAAAPASLPGSRAAASVPGTKAMQDALAAARTQNAALQQGLAKWQAAYGNAAEVARAKDAESRQAGAGLQADARALDTCKAANTKLQDVAEDILHLYETQSFRSLLLRSYEPVIGTARVRLENTVQDYDDKIRDQEYVPRARPTVR